MNKQKYLSQKLKALLQMERVLVGVKLAYSQEEYDSFEGKELAAPLEYCVCVRSASEGHCLKLPCKYSKCVGSTRALGFQKPNESFYDGTGSCRLGLFEDVRIAAKVNAEMKILDKPLYGVIVKPLEFFEKDPDVVILITNAREMMRLIQGYTCIYGMQSAFNITGNQAVCVECTAYPVITGKMNISFLCSGTRFLAEWNENEVGAGVPWSQLEGLIEGISKTVNGTELDSRKEEIRNQLHNLGEPADWITCKTAYYLASRPKKI